MANEHKAGRGVKHCEGPCGQVQLSGRRICRACEARGFRPVELQVYRRPAGVGEIATLWGAWLGVAAPAGDRG